MRASVKFFVLAAAIAVVTDVYIAFDRWKEDREYERLILSCLAENAQMQESPWNRKHNCHISWASYTSDRTGMESKLMEAKPSGRLADSIVVATLSILFFGAIPYLTAILWRFLLNRIREVGRAIRGE